MYGVCCLLQEESTQSEYSDSPSSDCAGSKSKSLKRSHKMIRFGTNVDLSDHRKWATQLDELKKLPKFLNVRQRQFFVMNITI